MSLDHAWLKGVPMDLNQRYYPKPPPRFKDIDIYIPLDAIENDYDFTEERRVLAECKMWEEDKEKERLAWEEQERIRKIAAEEEERIRKIAADEEERIRKIAADEEERIRKIAEEEERLRQEEQERLEREEAEAAGVAALEAQAELAEANKLQQQQQKQQQETQCSDQDTSPTTVSSSIATELISKLEINNSRQPPPTSIANTLDNSLASAASVEDSSNVLGNHFNSAGSSHHESPTSEENSVSSQSQSQPVTVPVQTLTHIEGENGGIVHPPPPQQHQQAPYPGMNGYHYPMPPMYQQQQPQQQQQQQHPHQSQYYNNYMASPAPVIPPPQYQNFTQPAPPPESSTAPVVNSFTKLHFPFLTSINASSYPRNSYLSSPTPGAGGSTTASAPMPTPHPSQDDIVSQNPFLSNYVQSLSSSPMHQHGQQYWPTTSHLPPQQPQGGTGPLVHHPHQHHPTS